jgi:hypothetical protein
VSRGGQEKAEYGQEEEEGGGEGAVRETKEAKAPAAGDADLEDFSSRRS